jgi:hypothetical protein
LLCLPIDDWRTQKRFSVSDINHHLHTWTPQLLGNSLQEAGYEFRRGDIRIRTSAWPPYHEFIYARLPDSVFDGLCFMRAFLTHHRELLAVARPSSRSSDGPRTLD